MADIEVIGGPRIGGQASPEDLEKIEEGLHGAGYELGGSFTTREKRFRHPNGTTARLFLETGHFYVYPPGGTDHQTGPVAPFSPLKRECADANRRAGFGDAEADEDPASSSDAGNDDGSGDPSTEDEGSDDGDDE